MWQGVCWCCTITVAYVASLHLAAWGTPPWRQHPVTVKRRMLGVLACSCVAWLPAYVLRAQKAAGAKDVPGMLPLLGLSGQQLLPALVLPLLLVVVLFLGPLLFAAHTSWEQRASGAVQQQGSSSSSSGSGVLHVLRDCVVAPLTEEWCFRSCMLCLLWLEGARPATAVWLTPLFFGAGHLHHARELLLVHRWPLRDVLHVVCFQLAYTTLFGWFAAWTLMATGRPAVLVHALCNWMGVPPFAAMAAHRHRRCWLAATGVGIAGFATGLAWMARAAPVASIFTARRGGA